MSAQGLFTARDLAPLLSLSEETLYRKATRERLEANGFPPPRMQRPLRWPARAVLRWIETGDGALVPEPAAAPTPEDEKAAWKARLAKTYGGGENP